MHFTSIFILFILTTFVKSAPTPALDAQTLLQNAQAAQQLNAQFQSANNTAATSICNNGDTTCVGNAIATCVNGQFDTSNGQCPATQQCFALPSVTTNGTIIACTSEKSAQSLINAAGATGDVTGSGSGGSTTSNGTTSNGTIAGVTTVSQSVITVTTITVTVSPSASIIQTPFPTVTQTQTLSPDQAFSLLSSLFAAQGTPTATGTPNGDNDAITITLPPATVNPTPIPQGDDECSESSTFSATLPPATVSNPTSSSPPTSAATVAAIANNTGSSTSSGSSDYGYGAGGY